MISSLPLIAVDVGNSRIKLGLFRLGGDGGFPEPETTLHLAGRRLAFDQLADWLAAFSPEACVSRGAPARASGLNPGPRRRWHIGSVNRPTASQLIDWVRENRQEDEIMLLTSGDLPLTIRVPRPDRVGVDRLLDAVAANRLRTPQRKAVVVDVGSAITVDFVDADGAFCGGAILPGIAMSARALHEFTDLLPLMEMSELVEPPPALGTDTVAALRSGLFWGAVGSVRQLVQQLARGAEVPPASVAAPIDSAADTPALQDIEIFLTGGAGPVVARLLGPAAHFVPHLTLAGIALAASQGKYA